MTQIAVRTGPNPRDSLHTLGLSNSGLVEFDGSSVAVCVSLIISSLRAICDCNTYSFLLYATTPSSFINNGSPSYFA
jgi:hypothetical protein